VKRIKLNPKNKHLNKKIVREVKLLSSLNHENIVRYYNSWIEETTIVKEEDSDAESGTPVRKEKMPVVKRLGEVSDFGSVWLATKFKLTFQFTVNDRIEDFALSAKSIVTCVSKSTASFNADSDEESGEEISWGVFKEDSDSDGIEFERDSIADTEDNQESSQTSRPADRKDDTLQDDNQVENVLYIQMELCEKNTLRNAIDAGVYKDKQRVLRLFREIIEGLAHIHQQGMIHRDLKPVNIFLDSRDRVKIGDFGLATNTKTKRYELTTPSQSHREDAMDESKTGLIGTALYVAPEVSTGSKVNYNEKVDIYSLGIIFFEMCYRPLPTAMERITILTGLRKKEIEVPEDFTDPSDRVLVDWLLNHDSSKRPTSHQLLQSEHLPSLMVEEGKFRALVKRTLSDPQLKGYKYIIASCFDQKLNLPEDITYDKDPSGPTLNKPQVYDFAKQIIIKIFKQHGGQNLSTPLLMPKSHYYEGVESCVKLMTHFGGIVSLPHDLRVPFARYVAWNGISLLRRYSIERVYREKKVFGFLPRELYECAFDIVTPAGTSRLPDVEILYIVYEIINELPGLKNKQVTIRLNHTNLMSAILTNSGIKERHQEVLQKFSDFKVKSSSSTAEFTRSVAGREHVEERSQDVPDQFWSF
jgi:translation initiation factor 2-alpha kinase 4